MKAELYFWIIDETSFEPKLKVGEYNFDNIELHHFHSAMAEPFLKRVLDLMIPKFLPPFMKEKNIKKFVPSKRPSIEVYPGIHAGRISVCIYHDAALHHEIYLEEKDRVRTPQEPLLTHLNELYKVHGFSYYDGVWWSDHKPYVNYANSSYNFRNRQDHRNKWDEYDNRWKGNQAKDPWSSYLDRNKANAAPKPALSKPAAATLACPKYPPVKSQTSEELALQRKKIQEENLRRWRIQREMEEHEDYLGAPTPAEIIGAPQAFDSTQSDSAIADLFNSKEESALDRLEAQRDRLISLARDPVPQQDRLPQDRLPQDRLPQEKEILNKEATPDVRTNVDNGDPEYDVHEKDDLADEIEYQHERMLNPSPDYSPDREYERDHEEGLYGTTYRTNSRSVGWDHRDIDDFDRYGRDVNDNRDIKKEKSTGLKDGGFDPMKSKVFNPFTPIIEPIEITPTNSQPQPQRLSRQYSDDLSDWNDGEFVPVPGPLRAPEA